MPQQVNTTFSGWVRRHSVSLCICGVFAIAFLALSFVGAPHVVDNYPDSHTYLPISFLGHAQRLWGVPLFYFVGVNSAGRVALQTVFGAICWITLAVQIGRALRTALIRFVAQIVVLLIGLTAPVLQWNRIVLSESITISLTVLVFATWLAFARRMDGRSLAALLVATVLWTFTRQVQTFVVAALVVPLAVLAWRRADIRRLALIGMVGIAVIGIWGAATALQTSKTLTEVQVAGIVQFRAIGNSGEMTFLREHGLPKGLALEPQPFRSMGQPVNVLQFGDPYAEYRLVADPGFRRWVDQDADHALIDYMVSHPWESLGDPLIHAPELLTMNPDYIASPALPQWASTAVYGDLRSVAADNSPAGPPRSSDPIYVVVLFTCGAALFVLTALRRRLSRTIWVAVGGVGFAAVWTIAIWNLAATDYPRIFLPTAVLFHVAIVLLIAGSLDAYFVGSVRKKKSSNPTASRQGRR